jgi:hypothetical protein
MSGKHRSRQVQKEQCYWDWKSPYTSSPFGKCWTAKCCKKRKHICSKCMELAHMVCQKCADKKCAEMEQRHEQNRACYY